MDENIDRLNETFQAHEHLTPNIVEVLERANLRARTYRRRRRAAQATGASVLGAGIVASGVMLPGRHGGSTVDVGTAAGGTSVPVASAPALPASSPTPVASATVTATSSQAPDPTSDAGQRDLAAYFAAGYDYDNAVALSKLWNEPDLAKVKVDAGLMLLQGSTLPVAPNGTPETPQEKAQDAFFSAGYDSDDAVALGKLWHETDLAQIKTEAGQKLLAGQSLPIAPTGSSEVESNPLAPPEAATKYSPALAAYFDAGYGYDDAVELGKLWHETDLSQIKIAAGQKLLDGQSLPIAP